MRILAATYGVEPDLDEDEIAYRPWGFALEDVRVPVRAWHGTRDEAVPVELLRRALSRVPDADVTVSGSPGSATFVAQMLEASGAPDDDALAVETFRRLPLDEALGLLAPAPG